MLKKNYEIKVPVKNYDALVIMAGKLRKSFRKHEHYTETQKDIYYKVPKGRLKLRVINNTSGSLIRYERKEAKSKRVSNYIISKTKDFKELDAILKKLHGEKVTVDKEREIFIYDNVRVHLDSVKKLGSFLELEVIFDDFSKAKKQLDIFMKYFGLNEKEFIKGSYSDMLLRKQKNNVARKR